MKKKYAYKIGIWLVTVLVAFVIMFPVVWIISSSFTPEDELYTVPVSYLPSTPTLDNYKVMFKIMDVPRMAVNTLLIAIISIVVTIFVAYTAGYAARVQFRGKETVYSLLTFSAMLPMIITLVPFPG